MRNIKEILRLKWLNQLSVRAIARSCGSPRSTVSDCIHRGRAAGLSWPLPDDLNEAQLEQLLYPPIEPISGSRPLPDFAHVHQELKRKGVTLFLLWQEYKAQYPDEYVEGQAFIT